MPGAPHKNPRRQVTLPQEEFDRYDEHCARSGMSWAEWVVALQRAACPPAKEVEEDGNA